MKRLFFKLLLVIPVFALAGCVETLEDSPVPSSRKVTFQTASYPTTRATGQPHKGTEFTYDHFMTFAWSEAVVADDKVFMNHQKVVKSDDGKSWEPTSVYYWPTYTPVDFISYFPEKTNYNLAVERAKLTYTGYEVYGETALNTSSNDLMYADKAVGYGANVDEVNDDLGGANDHGYTGVPTLFNHALAQLEIRVLVQQPEGETTFHWEAVIDQAELKGLYTKGDLTLRLKDPSATHGVVEWVTEGADDDAKKAGWVHDKQAKEQAIVGGTADKKNFTVISTDDYGVKNGDKAVVGCASMYKAFVLPQVLEDTHLLDLKLTVNKYKTGTTDPQTSEKDKEVRHLQLKTGDITVWGMNQRVVYTIVINPAKNGKILFDPAIKEWVDVSQEKDADDKLEPKYYFPIPTEEQWAQSNVWYAMKDGQPVAEIAKEAAYTLTSRGLPAKYYQVVSVYPVLGGRTDLSKGMIAQVIRAEDGSAVTKMASGKIAMRQPDNGTYKKGCYAIAEINMNGGEDNHSQAVIDKEGNVTFVTPGFLDEKLDIKPVTVEDLDKNTYPIVKIGVTYWTRENLRVTKYNDGTALEEKNASETYTAGDECVWFAEKAPMYSWYSNGDFDVSVQSDDVKKRYGLLYNHRAICGADDPWTSNGDFMQQGDPLWADEAGFQAEPNKQLAPSGWHIPTINYYMRFRPGHADVDYVTEFINEDWRRCMTNNIATGERDLATAQWPAHPKNTSFSNITDLSLDATPAFGQTDADAFDPTSPSYSGQKLKGLVFFWTSSLTLGSKQFYPGYVPCTSYQDKKIEVWYMDSPSYNKVLAYQYLPVRCVRN